MIELEIFDEPVKLNVIDSLTNEELLLQLYVFTDDQLHAIKGWLDGHRLPRDPRGRPEALSASEVITMLNFGHLRKIANKKELYRIMDQYHRREFPNLPSYSAFVEATNRVLQDVMAALAFWLAVQRSLCRLPTLQLQDSLPIPVCHNLRIASHRVFAGLATRSKSTMGWFYGFKLHVLCDVQGQIYALALTPANLDDRKLVQSFTRWIRHGWLVADAGYLSKELCAELRRRGIILVTPLRKNMKVLATETDLALMKLRRMIESLFSVLKERMGLLRSTHRAAVAGFVHIFSCVLAYCFRWLLAHQVQFPTQVNALLFP